MNESVHVCVWGGGGSSIAPIPTMLAATILQVGIIIHYNNSKSWSYLILGCICHVYSYIHSFVASMAAVLIEYYGFIIGCGLSTYSHGLRNINHHACTHAVTPNAIP